VQLALWADLGTALRRLVGPPPAAAGPLARPTAESLITRLRALGLPPFPDIETHRNRQVMLSYVPGRQFRLHEGYADAPDEVLEAIVRFVTPGVRRLTRMNAKRTFLAFPADEHAPAPAQPRRPPRPRPGDRHLLGELQAEYLVLNREHFAGSLAVIPIVISGRMRTRLGELRMDRKTGHPIHIALSRRHLRRDGWAAARETLLHEMVHQWQAETGRPVDHGAEFRRKARQVGITPRAVRQPD
jgi:SprT-like family